MVKVLSIIQSLRELHCGLFVFVVLGILTKIGVNVSNRLLECIFLLGRTLTELRMGALDELARLLHSNTDLLCMVGFCCQHMQPKLLVDLSTQYLTIDVV